jgi:DNA-binding SARP family transcriptional activator
LIDMIYDQRANGEGESVGGNGSSHELRIYLFGELKIRLNGQPIGGNATDKAKSMLAYLAVEAEKPHRREFLAEMFWPERPQGTARNNLRQALLTLRLSLGERDSEQPYLLPTSDDIQFNSQSPFYLDTREFDRLIRSTLTHEHELLPACKICEDQLRRAVGCYQDDFLINASLPDLPDFESWVVIKRESYRRDYAMALHTLITMHERRGDYLEGSRFARRLVELEPWDEANHRILMRSLALGGMRSAALKQYQACKRVLAAEFRIEPSKETTELYNVIRYERLEELREDSTSGTDAVLTQHSRQVLSQDDRREVPESRTWRWPTALLILGAGTVILIGASLLRSSSTGSEGLAEQQADQSDGSPIAGDPVGERSAGIGEELPGEIQTVENSVPAEAPDTSAPDAYRLLSSDACAQGERPLYLEDFQDRNAPEWQEIQLQAQGWGFTADPDQSQNFVAVHPNYPSSPPEGFALTTLDGFKWNDAVARIRFKPVGAPRFHFHWRYSWERYQIEGRTVTLSTYNLRFNEGSDRVLRSQVPISHIILHEIPPIRWSQEWHLIEIATFDGQLDIWIDGKMLMSYIDPKPIPPGTLAIAGYAENEGQSRVYFDDIVICELTAPFVSIAASES